MNELNPFAWHGAPYLVFYTMACVVAIGIACVVKMQILGKLSPDVMTTSNECDSIASQLNAYEVAALQGGRERVFACALATLTSHDLIGLDLNRRLIDAIDSTPVKSDLHPIERAILDRLKGGTLSIETAKSTMLSEMGDINARLQDFGLIPPASEVGMSRVLPMLVLAVSACTLAIPKLFIGSSLHKPVALLFAEMVVFCIISLFFLREQAETTGKGDVVIAALARSSSALKLTAKSNPAALSLADTAFAYALFGGMAIIADPFAQAMKLVKPQPPTRFASSGCGGGFGGCGSSSSCGSSSTCGSSCGGGGCGGCGGCGG